MSKKIVVKVDLGCTKCKRRAMETIARVEGVDTIASDDKSNQITVTGDTDPVILVDCLRAFGHADLVSVGPEKEPKKEPEEKKEPPKQAEPTPNPIYVVLQPSPCDPYPCYTHCCSDENPNSCCIT